MTDLELIAGKLYRCARCGVRYWTDAGEHRCEAAREGEGE